jgi:hypothetical protein
MQLHWEELLELFSVLAYLIKKKDRDGFKVFFTISPDKHKFKTTTDALRLLRSKTPLGMSDISLRLGNILKGYQDELEEYQVAWKHFQAAWKHYQPASWPRRPKRPRSMKIYVLTDGAWEPGRDIETPIRSLVKQLTEVQMKRGQCGIQFIQFGTDHLAASELQHLDEELKLPM